VLKRIRREECSPKSASHRPREKRHPRKEGGEKFKYFPRVIGRRTKREPMGRREAAIKNATKRE